MKGISPLIASVLLIGFTVAVAGLVSVWLTSFTRTTTGTISDQGTEQVVCSFGGVGLSSLVFRDTSKNLTGNIENTGTVNIGEITLQLLYGNATIRTIYLCSSGDTVFDCIDIGTANLSLAPGVKKSFNVGAGCTAKGNISTVRVYTNCSNVDDEATGSEIS